MSEYKFSIEANYVNKTYIKKDGERIEALNNFNVNIPKGSIYGLLGPNGAGKSTFINILANLVKKDSGTIKISGINLDTNSKACRKKIGIVPQELNIDPFFTPIELLNLQSGLYGVRNNHDKCEQILKKIGLIDQKNSYARTLSGGMRRRLLIAKALVHDPDIIILDEPTAGVDVNLRKMLWEYIKELKKKGKTICLTTHYLEEAEILCDEITIINKGKMIKTDLKENFVNLFSEKKVIFQLTDNEFQIPVELNKFKPLKIKNKITLTYNVKETTLRQIIKIFDINKIEFNEINTEEGSLEKTFVKLINDN